MKKLNLANSLVSLELYIFNAVTKVGIKIQTPNFLYKNFTINIFSSFLFVYLA